MVLVLILLDFYCFYRFLGGFRWWNELLKWMSDRSLKDFKRVKEEYSIYWLVNKLG